MRALHIPCHISLSLQGCVDPAQVSHLLRPRCALESVSASENATQMTLSYAAAVADRSDRTGNIDFGRPHHDSHDRVPHDAVKASQPDARFADLQMWQPHIDIPAQEGRLMIKQLKPIGKGQQVSEMSRKASDVIENLIKAYQKKLIAAEKSEKVRSRAFLSCCAWCLLQTSCSTSR